MACVSFNKVRLQYYVSKGHTRACWIYRLLRQPANLFGTTLIGVNVALQIGSECSRQLYATLNLSPDLAPITQVLLVLIIAELSPMFAARRHPEHVAMLGIPITYTCSRILLPAIWAIDHLSSALNYLVGKKDLEADTYLSRDELINILQDQDASLDAKDGGDDFDAIVEQIFSLREKSASDLMQPLANVRMLSSKNTLAQMNAALKRSYVSYLPIYHRERKNIVGVAHARDMIRLPNHSFPRDHARAPWFVTANSKVVKILRQFRHNEQSVAVVLGSQGHAVGILTLDAILESVFKQHEVQAEMDATLFRVVEKSFPGDTRVDSFNREYNGTLPVNEGDTLAKLMIHRLGHPPKKGETVRVDNYELKAEDISLIGAKVISIRSMIT